MIHPRQKNLFAVIGNPVAHSLSPVMMQAVFDHLRLPAAYLALEADSIAEDLDTLWKMGFMGLSVTLPHKETAFRQVLSSDDTSKEIGAVNTLRRHQSGWEGMNTDWIGSNGALEQGTPLGGKRALVLGAGGAARAVVYGLKRSGARVWVANRTVERGKALARAFGCDFLPLSDLRKDARESPFDILVQCTSVGLMEHEAEPLIPYSFFRPGMVVMDTVYRPLWTNFLKEAGRAGCITVHGSEMLLHQGVAQVEWWLRQEKLPPEAVQAMRKALWKALSHDEDS